MIPVVVSGTILTPLVVMVGTMVRTGMRPQRERQDAHQRDEEPA
jgi:preprotein translocase subunit YajC